MSSPTCAVRHNRYHHSNGNCRQRQEMRHGETQRHSLVHPNELNDEPQRAGADEITAKDDRVVDAALAPPQQKPPQDRQADRFVQLRWVHCDCGRGESFGKRHGPREIRRSAVVVTDKEAADAAEQVSERERGRRRGQRWNEGPPFDHDVCEAGTNASDQASVPTQSAARE